jgi:hypothetical protein
LKILRSGRIEGGRGRNEGESRNKEDVKEGEERRGEGRTSIGQIVSYCFLVVGVESICKKELRIAPKQK